MGETYEEGKGLLELGNLLLGETVGLAYVSAIAARIAIDIST